jgi:ABC-2 type transport system ATP-binding protein
MPGAIELKNVTKMYGSSRGVEDVTLVVPVGSVFGFLGPNGAGKTTTISMLIDLIRPTKGEIEVLGLNVKTHSKEIRAKVGYLAGDMALDASLNGWQQLEYLGNLRGGFNKAYVSELAKRLECDLSRKFKHLSRGNRQKVGLIAALMHEPELLIFDEPTSGLDPLTQAEFNKIILEHKAAGKTAFISSHMLSEVQEICDSVTFIREGQIIATKSVNELTVEAPKLLRLSADKNVLAEVEKLTGLVITSRQNGLLGATYQGDLNKLLAVLAAHKIKDFSLSDTDLETAFLKYYEEDHA